MKKTYFIAPNLDIAPPPHGPLKLGHLIRSPDDPDIFPVNEVSHFRVPSTLPPMVKEGFESSRSRLLSGELGLWAQVAAYIGLHANANIDASSDGYIKVQKVETLAFRATDEYLSLIHI